MVLDTNQLDSRVEAASKIDADVRILRESILAGKSTGNKIKDWAIVNLGPAYKNASDKLDQISDYLVSKRGELAMISYLIKEGDYVHVTHCDPGPNRYETFERHDTYRKTWVGTISDGIEIIKNPLFDEKIETKESDLWYELAKIEISQNKRLAEANPIIARIAVKGPTYYERRVGGSTFGTKPKKLEAQRFKEGIIERLEKNIISKLKLENGVYQTENEFKGESDNAFGWMSDSHPDMVHHTMIAAGNRTVLKQFSEIIENERVLEAKNIEELFKLLQSKKNIDHL